MQDIKKVHQEHVEAKAVKIGTTVVPNTSRLNPDSSFGIHNTAEVRASARAVQNARMQKKQMQDTKKIHNDQKVVELNKKKTNALNIIKKDVFA